MEKISTLSDLKEQILILEMKQISERRLLQDQLQITYESLRPFNLIKNTLKEITTIPDLKGDLINTTLSIAAGYLSKKAAVGETHNPLKQILGTFLQLGVTSVVSKNGSNIKAAVGNVFKTLFNKKETQD